MTGSQVQGIRRSTECLIIRNLPLVSKKLAELFFLINSKSSAQKVTDSIKEDIDSAIQLLQSMKEKLEQI